MHYSEEHLQIWQLESQSDRLYLKPHRAAIESRANSSKIHG
jgi:hypothetical protein